LTVWWLGLGEVGKPKGVAQQAYGEAAGEAVAIGLGSQARLKVSPMGLGDAPVATDLIAQLQATQDVVVGGVLVLGAELGYADHPARGQQPALDGDGVKGQLCGLGGSLGASSHGQLTFGRRTKTPITSGRGSASTRALRLCARVFSSR
jgi:hypothetical protein